MWWKTNRTIKVFFTSAVGGKFKGFLYGFPIGGKCVINRNCKIRPIKSYYKQFKGYEIVQYVGIAKDEPKRLSRLKSNQVSLLDRYGYTESMAMNKCKDYGLVSPIYENGSRGGCWFCMNASIQSYSLLKMKHPELWGELRELSKTPNLCSYGFKYGKTLQQVEKEMDAHELNQKIQLSLF